MFIELLDQYRHKIMINLDQILTISPYSDPNEKKELLKTGVLIVWKRPEFDSKGKETSDYVDETYYGIDYHTLCNVLHKYGRCIFCIFDKET